MRVLNPDGTLKEVRTRKVTIMPLAKLTRHNSHETKRHCAFCGVPLHRWNGKSGMQPEGKALCKHCSARANGLGSRKETK